MSPVHVSKLCLLFVCHATMLVQAKIDMEVQDSLKLVLENVKHNHPKLKFTFSKEKKEIRLILILPIDWNCLSLKKIIWNLFNFSLSIVSPRGKMAGKIEYLIVLSKTRASACWCFFFIIKRLSQSSCFLSPKSNISSLPHLIWPVVSRIHDRLSNAMLLIF